MNPQPSLFDAPPWRRYGFPHTREPGVRSAGPDTSRAAAVRVRSEQDRQQLAIHAYLIGVGPHGATAKEIAFALDWGEGGNVKVSRRIAEMRDGAMISTYDGKPDEPPPDGPGHLTQDADHAPREGCAVHIAREHTRRAA